MSEHDNYPDARPAIDSTRWIATYIAGKVEELHHHLIRIVETCGASLAAVNLQKPQPQTLHKIIVYDFSSLVNTVQTLKDSAAEAIGSRISWSEIEALRHGTFFYLGRNAATHDGNPLISAWSDGYFFVPNDIVRRDKRGLIRIPAPQVDVRTFCLEFALDYSDFLTGRLSPAMGDEDVASAPDNLDQMLKFMMQSPIVPSFVKEMVSSNTEQIIKAITEAPSVDPIATAVAELNKVRSYCIAQLAEVPPMFAGVPSPEFK